MNPDEHAAHLTAFRDAYHLPDDAGSHAEALTRILQRIPVGWGRWISCGPGWYPLLADLDQRIAKIAPTYEVHQVKEKFGTLRYYWSLPTPEPECCQQRQAADPRPADGPVDAQHAPAGRSSAQQAALEAWWQREEAHLDSSEHAEGAAARAAALQAQAEERNAVAQQVRDIVHHAEQQSARTCETCGQEGSVTRQHGWLTTLCPTHAGQG